MRNNKNNNQVATFVSKMDYLKIRFRNRDCSDRRGLSSAILVLSVIVALLIGAIVGIYVQGWNEPSGNNNDSEQSITQLRSQLESLQKRTSFLENLISDYSDENHSGWPVDDLYRLAEPSIVKISVETTTSGLFDPSTSTAQGSGFVFDLNGHILTNQHVVEDADRILVKFTNGETVEAELIGGDIYSDLAVLKVTPTDIEDYPTPLTLGDSSDIKPGDRIIAIGSPFGLTGTTTTGVVSQVERLLNTESGYGIPGVLQIDAAINPGNSGGPLFSFSGKVIGITTAIQSQTGTFSGIGFAVPSNLVMEISNALIENGNYDHPWIGIRGTNVDYSIAKERGLEKTRGFLINFVEEDSPASKAGLKQGDVLMRIDGRAIIDLGTILSYIELKKSPGETVTFEVLRDGERRNVNLELGIRPPFNS